MMRDLLSVGSYVLVSERGQLARKPYFARVRGYDLHRTKYEIGRRYAGWGLWLFAKGGEWAFPGWCVPVSKDVATAFSEVTL